MPVPHLNILNETIRNLFPRNNVVQHDIFNAPINDL